MSVMLEIDDVYREVNRVEPSLIRVEADEVTYNLHIMIRFELELALLRGQLEVAELPGAWDDAYERRLGIRAPDASFSTASTLRDFPPTGS